MNHNHLATLSSRIRLDFRSGTPIYIQVMDQVKQQVVSGTLKPGDQLPTVRALATELRVNFNTIARAYRLLDEAGVISTQRGRGTYILDLPPLEVSEAMQQKAMSTLTDQYLADAIRLGFSPQEIVSLIKKHIADRRSDEQA